MTGITIYWLTQALGWIYSLNLEKLSPEVVALALGVLTALCALVKITFTFAAANPDSKT
jgi:hypothetical protein